MIVDAHNTYSDAQAITAAAVSTNVIDHGIGRDLSKGNAIPLLIQIVEDFNNLTNLTVSIEQSDTEDFAVSETVASTGAVALADLKTGYRFSLKTVPAITKRFSRVRYAPTGTVPTTGKVTTAVIGGEG